MSTCFAKGAHSEPRRRLIEFMQAKNFGRIEDLIVRNGEPVLEPPPTFVREVKFGGENGPRPESGAADFRLKAQIVELFDEFDRLGNGTLTVLEFKHGLPFRMFVLGTAA
jgi:hypothetical protein